MNIQRLVVLDDNQEYIALFAGFADLLNLKFDGFTEHSKINFSELKETDLLILDIYMPEKDALDIILDLSNLEFKSNLALMSGTDQDTINSVQSTINLLKISFCGALSKPIRFNALRDLIAKADSQLQQQSRIQNTKMPVDLTLLSHENNIKQWFSNKYVYPVFQPQYDSDSEKITGIECLTRVNLPNIGAISPFDFIAAVEQNNRIDEYTLYFIDNALTSIHSLLLHNPHLSCSFNISAQNLDKAFADKLVNLFQNYTVLPKQITLEITESNAIKMTSEALYAISRLKLFGVKLAIDDFGTGYSSISQLVDLPFDEIKIDRSFVCQLADNKKAQAIISATFNLATSLHFNLIVEGVETQEQLDFLRDKGNCMIQGYLLSKPLSTDDLQSLILGKGKFKRGSVSKIIKF